MDFDIIYFSLPLAFSVFIAVALVIAVFSLGRKSKSHPEYNNAVPVIEIIKALEKICPVSSRNKWKLFPFDQGCHSCWIQTVALPFLQNNINLYGSATTINSSSANICSLIADVSKWSEWNPFFTSQYIVKPFHDKQLRRDHYMEAEQVISIFRDTNKIQSDTIMYRFHDFSESKVGWILLWNPKKLEFLYFLIQPVKNKNENPLCLLTHIMGSESKRSASSVSLISQRLRNIQDLFILSSLRIVPSKFMSSDDSSSVDSASENKSNLLNANNQENYFSLSSVRVHKREVRNTVFILVPFIQSKSDFWKKDMEFKLAVKNMEPALSEKKVVPPGAKENVSNSKNESLLKRPLRRAASDVGVLKSKVVTTLKKNVDIAENDIVVNSDSQIKKYSSEHKERSVKPRPYSDTSEDSESANNLSSKGKMFSGSKLRSLSETAVNNLENCEFSCKSGKAKSDPEGVSKLQNISENIENKLLAVHEQDCQEIFNSSVSDFEIVENCEFTENRIAAFMTQGNYGAAELQAEVLVASHFLHDMSSGNYQSLGGWSFHSYYKGLCVLAKTTCSQFLRISSFLCQTELPVAPKDTWKFVKCPQFRFICDESVKSVEVLEKISNSQKLIHTYQEVGGFIKKELIDFCLLQTEREEHNKFYSCFSSIEYDKCPFMKSVTRGTLRPSGWIVEKVDEDPNASIVTYMMQGLISSPDSLFIQELSTMVPQSVYNLKHYITSKPM